MKKLLTIIGALALLGAVTSQAQTTLTLTNASGGISTYTLTSDSMTTNPATTTVGNIAKAVPAGVIQVGTDGYNVFKNFSITNPISIGVVGLKNGNNWGGGIEANTIRSDSPVSAGFGVFGIQTQTTDASGHNKTSFNFYDATINLSVSTVENIPVLNIPLTIRIFSGPFASLNGGVLIGEQSGTSGDVNLRVGTLNQAPCYIDFGGGAVNCAGAAAKDLKSVMPMAHANFTFTF